MVHLSGSMLRAPDDTWVQRTVRRAAPLLLIAVLSSLGCASKQLKGPDLGEIYNRSAHDHSGSRNPIIVIPGIMGTRLVDDASGTTVWGAFTGEYARPGTPAGARLIALPMREGVALAQELDDVRPDGVLEQVRVRVAGIPLRVRAYFQILEALGAGGYRDESLGLAGAIDYGDEHFTCFQFGYDWRRDISETAAELDRFIEKKRAYVRAEMKRRYGIVDREIRFDIVAHSMGGLVARYFLRYGGAPLAEDGSPPKLTWAGARKIENVILIAPPNAGSVLALDNLVRGVKVGPTIPRYPPLLVGTMPAAYQLLPRTRHRTVVVDGPSGQVFPDLFDIEVWKTMGWGLAATDQDEALEWLLPEISAADRKRVALDYLQRSLDRARQFTEAIDRPASPPPGTKLVLVAGDSKPTASSAEVDPLTGALTISGEAPGDGTVLRSSALMDERIGGNWAPRLVSPIDWSQVMFLFRDHLGLTHSQEFIDNLLFVLLEK